MFTGIIKQLGEVKALRRDGGNLHITLSAPFEEAIHIDQSIAHQGVCLTVTEILEAAPHSYQYTVTAIDETLSKTNLGSLLVGDRVNLELCMKAGDRLDGHFVQGHVDTVGQVLRVQEVNGSWLYDFEYPASYRHLIVEKGSICVNGVSLTVVQCPENRFQVAIIPYTYEHTQFHQLKEGDRVNLEFDVLGKYVARMKEVSM